MREKIASKNRKYKYILSFLNGFLLLFLSSGLVYAQIERWVYTYNGPGNGDDEANSIVYGGDGTLYAAGYSTGSGTGKDFIIISLRTSGDENWVYRYIGYGDERDIANSIVFGADFNIYVGGMAVGTDDTTAIPYISYFTVISLTTSGYVNWIYRYDDPENSSGGVATSIIYGADDNIYAAGALDLSGMTTILGMISFNTSGDTNWTYECGAGVVNSIVYGADGNIYATGYSAGSTGYDFTVISLKTSGNTNWIYKYNGSEDGNDIANAIVYGKDGNLYAAGYSRGDHTEDDFTVISLDPISSIEEYSPDPRPESNFELLSYFFNEKISIRFANSSSDPLSITIYNILGAQVYTTSFPSTPPYLCLSDKTFSKLPKGIYFLSISQNGKTYPVTKLIKP